MKYTSASHHKYEPMYGWALDRAGQPVPISSATRGEMYQCPVCHGDMVAKLGDIKQHHFAHVSLLQCTPDNVARAVVGRWLAEQLRSKLAKGETCPFTWRTQSEQHTLNLLRNVARVEQDQALEHGMVDIVLLDAQDHATAIILLSESAAPQSWVAQNTCVLSLNFEGVRGGNMNLEGLLNDAQVMGGWLLIAPEDLPNGLIIGGAGIKQALFDLVYESPIFVGELASEGNMGHILQAKDKKLWLPLEVWEQLIGGQKNRLATNVQVIIQEFPQDDGAKIATFYIMVGDTVAVGLRRYAPAEAVVIQLNTSGFRLFNISAIDVARQLTGMPSQLPQ